MQWVLCYPPFIFVPLNEVCNRLAGDIAMLDLEELSQIPTHELAEYLIQILGKDRALALTLYLQLKLKVNKPLTKEEVGRLSR